MVRVLAVLLPLGFLFVSPVWAQTEEPGPFFPETGHWVTDEFLAAYRAQPLAEAIYGYPLTDAFTDQETGYLVQFFQQAYFEYHHQRPVGQRVVRLELGRLLYTPATPANLHPRTPGCIRHAGWEYPVCDDFYEFYIANGGEAVLGPPISGLEIRDLIAQQHFVYARLEFNPQRPRGHQIQFAQLGREYFIARQQAGWVSSSQLLPAIRNTQLKESDITSLRVDVFPQRSRIPLGEAQTLVVTVRDQSRTAVFGATVSAVATLPDGSSQPLGGVLTNEQGIARFIFTPNLNQVGIVEIEVSVRYASLHVTGTSGFRVWY